jgi:hypothetical protein
MGGVYATGENYQFDLEEDGIARLRVWKRPDLAMIAGAHAAVEIQQYCKTLFDEGHHLVFDMRDAPKVAGPRTQAAITEIILSARRSRRRFAVVVGDASIQRLQMNRLATEHSSGWAALFRNLERALRWARTGSG